MSGAEETPEPSARIDEGRGSGDGHGERGAKPLPGAGAGIALLLGVAIVATVVLDEGSWERLLLWLRGSGAAGVCVFALAYLVAVVVLLPGSVLTLGAGFVYGPFWGAVLVSPVSVAAATLAFFLARGWARPWVLARVGSHKRLVAVDRAIGTQGFKTVVLLRLSPLVPFSLLNYLLGITRVRPLAFVAGSALGMLPGTVLYVYVGSLVRTVAELTQGGNAGGNWLERLFFGGGLVATALVTWSITRAARRSLAATLTAHADPEVDPPDSHVAP